MPFACIVASRGKSVYSCMAPLSNFYGYRLCYRYGWPRSRLFLFNHEPDQSDFASSGVARIFAL